MVDWKLAFDLSTATEEAAIAAANWVGKGDAKKADGAAVEAMRKRLSQVAMSGRIVIGEGERDEAPMLFIGEEVGDGSGEQVDIAVDPLECTNYVATGRHGALAVLAVAPRGKLLHAPDCYMDKIAVGPKCRGKVDLDWPVEENIRAVAEALGKTAAEVSVVVMDRERHSELINKIRATGASVHLITDGDVWGAVSTSMEGSGVDLLLGIGAAPEGVLAAAALKALGGEIQGRLKFKDLEEKKRAEEMGLKDPDAKLSMDDLAQGDDCFFIATGVTTGSFLKGPRIENGKVKTHSVIMEAKTGAARFVETEKNLR